MSARERTIGRLSVGTLALALLCLTPQALAQSPSMEVFKALGREDATAASLAAFESYGLSGKFLGSVQTQSSKAIYEMFSKPYRPIAGTPPRIATFHIAPGITVSARAWNATVFKTLSGESIGSWSAPVTVSVEDAKGRRSVKGQGRFVMSFDQTWGHVDTAEASYLVLPTGKAHQATMKLVAEAVPPDHPKDGAAGGRKGDGGGKAEVIDQGAYDCSTQNSPEGTQIQVSLGIVFTRAALLAFSEQVFARPCAMIYKLIGDLNDSLAVSEAPVRFQLVGSALVAPYKEPMSGGTRKIADVFSDVRDASSGIGTAVDHWRRRRKVNVVVVLAGADDACGISDGNMDKYKDQERAIAVADSKCAVQVQSASHEIGHIMGLRHDLRADPTTTPFSFGHGYVFRGSTYKFLTMMGSRASCNDCGRANRWSNPAVKESTEGRVTGDARTANEAAVLRQVAPVTSRFYE